MKKSDSLKCPSCGLRKFEIYDEYFVCSFCRCKQSNPRAKPKINVTKIPPTESVDVKLSASIMADPRREHLVPPLIEAIGKDIPVSWDDGSRNRIQTGKRAWLMHEPDATHHVVFQDDVIVCRDVLEGIENATKVLPHFPIQFFLMQRPKWKRFGKSAMEMGASFIKHSFIEWGAAISMPVGYIRPAFDWIEEKCSIPNYDGALGAFFLSIRMYQYFSVPSLVDHRTDVESLVWKDKHPYERRSIIFIGADKSGADVKWGDIVYDSGEPFSKWVSVFRNQHGVVL